MSDVWIATDNNGAVNMTYIVRVERDKDGSILHLTNGQTIKSPMMFDVVDGELIPIEPADPDDDCPF